MKKCIFTDDCNKEDLVWQGDGKWTCKWFSVAEQKCARFDDVVVSGRVKLCDIRKLEKEFGTQNKSVIIRKMIEIHKLCKVLVDAPDVPESVKKQDTLLKKLEKLGVTLGD